MKLLIKNASLFDGIKDSIRPNQMLMVEQGVITSVSDGAAAVNEADGIIDASGYTVIPGLIDAHTHIAFSDSFDAMDRMTAEELAVRSTVIARQMLERGFTTVRDVGSNCYGLKQSIDNGYVPGPRIYASYGAISQTCGHADYRQNRAQRSDFSQGIEDSSFMRQGHLILADGVPQCLKRTRDQIFMGASQIKVFGGGGASSLFDPLDTIQYTREELRAIVETVANYGSYVCSHIHAAPAMKIAIEEGIQCLEHATFMDDDIARQCLDNQVWVVPQYATAELIANRQIPLGSEILYQKTERVGKGLLQQAELVEKYGLKCAFGTDLVGTPEVHAKQNLELAARKKYFGSFRGLKQATSDAGELLKLSGLLDPYPEGDIGVLRRGAWADLLFVEGNPLHDLDILANPDNIKLVMKGGEVVKDNRQR
ncbi:amidohydrolase family protein [Ferrimonas sp. SCSIO 43195]|uniref:metal-dependent hydrolase family protein n=1 Tax=Ferrimonas sp. SCSIO 43195 TaxID=2822844 RepID=UPI00207563F9|nr:amidohydrolase family protein [Ferrimonas sp. SCSIO 43195]USD39605.1 amidohydrolase family protein [Ferrimonas sp. SCSIO 43195]